MKTLLIGINSKYIHPAMGIFQIYANALYPCDFKEFTIKDDIQNILDFINQQDFDILGFSVYIWNIEFIQKIISHLKHLKTIILGGPEASFRPNDFLFYENIRFIIKDEGEEAFNLLINELMTTNRFFRVPNLYFRNNNEFKYTYSQKPNINNIKYNYSLINDFKNRIVYLEASRGCCFRCTYCLAALDKGIRYLDFEIVKNNILNVLNKGAKTIKFLDRSFNIKKELMHDILKFIIDNDNLETSFQFEIVGDILDIKTIELLKKSRRGQIRFEIGIQSLNKNTNKAILRKQNLDKLIDNLNQIKDNIIIHLDLIAGLPFEGLNSFKNTFNNTFLLFADELQLGFLKELQGTQISQTKDLHDYEFSRKPPYEVIKNKYISKEELDEIRIVETGLNKFYNSKNFPKTLKYLFKDLQLDPYTTFLNLVKDYNIMQFKNLQFDEIANILYLYLKKITKNPEYILYLIKQDYLNKFNLRPKIFWECSITKKERSKIYSLFVIKYPYLVIDNLYRSSQLERFDNEYFIITYKPKKEILFLNI